MNGLAIPYDRDKLKLALLELEAKKVEVEGNRDLLVKKNQTGDGLIRRGSPGGTI